MIEYNFKKKKKCFHAMVLLLLSGTLLSSCSFNNFLKDKVEFFAEKEEIFKIIKSNKSVRSIRAFASFEIFFPETNKSGSVFHQEIGFEEGTFSGNAFLVWEKPNLFRIEILSPFGNPYFSIFAKGKSLKIFHITKQKLYVGDFTKKTMENLFGIPVELDMLLEIFSVLKPKFQSKNYRFDKIEGVLIPIKKDMKNSRTFWINKNSLMPKKVEIVLSGQKLFVRYLSYEKIDGILFPKTILLVNPKNKAHLKIEIEELNSSIFSSIQRNAFNFKVPLDVTIHHLFFD